VLLKSGNLALRLFDDQTVAVYNGQACGIVAAVLEPLEPGDEHPAGIPVTDIAHDSAHG
jgi:hypothetical protein